MTKAKIALSTVAVFAIVFAGVTAALKFNEWQKDNASVFSKPNAPLGGWLENVKLDPQNANSPDFRTAAKRILPCVVSVDTQVEGENFFGEHVVQDAGAGSGVVVTQDGYIVTNNHVLSVNTGFGRQRTVDKIRVTLSDGRTMSAKIIGNDPRSDIAVLKVDATGLSAIEVGDSSKLDVGQWVIAVGNPLGFANTLSVGVVSSVGRQLPGGSNDAVFMDGIQTDAAINHGNSGGALCTADGQLVGINSTIATTNNANIGIGFAIPSNRMKQVVDDIIKYGYAKYGQTGLDMLTRPGILGLSEARHELMQKTGSTVEPPTKGAVVLDVIPQSPAALAGVVDLDVVTEVNGKTVDDVEDYEKVVSPLRPGATLSIKVWSAGKVKAVRFTLTDAGKAST